MLGGQHLILVANRFAASPRKKSVEPERASSKKSVPTPIAPTAPEPAPEPLKQAAAEDEVSAGAIALRVGAAAAVVGASLFAVRCRPVEPAVTVKLCPDFKFPRRSSRSRCRPRGSRSDPPVLQSLADGEFRR